MLSFLFIAFGVLQEVTSLEQSTPYRTQIGPDAAINQKTCLAFQIGYEFLSRNAEMVFKQYVQRYNVEKPVERSIQAQVNYLNTDFDGMRFKIKALGDSYSMQQVDDSTLEFHFHYEAEEVKSLV